MNTKPSTENHFFVAHRDDVWLTFGGLILLKKYSSEKNIVHLLYGLDGYMIEDFKKKLIKKDPFIITYLRKLSIISGSEILFKEIIECLNRYNKDDNTFLGVNVRRLEEKSIAVRNDVILNEYMIPCGYPMRGYKTFNADQTSIFHDDINQQLRLLYDNSCSKSYYNKLKKIAKKNYVDLSDLPSIKDLINKFDKDKIYNLFFLSGIGGHPDHIIISKLAYIIKEKFGDKLNVYLGQDLPYATVSEWFQTSR